jgi:glucan phosphoethanolaminetransferase (alkaline phosphatase superfamily)
VRSAGLVYLPCLFRHVFSATPADFMATIAHRPATLPKFLLWLGGVWVGVVWTWFLLCFIFLGSGMLFYFKEWYGWE